MILKRFAPIVCLPILIFCLVILPWNSASCQTIWIPDYWPTVDWQTSTPESHGLNSAYLTALDDYINDQLWGNAMVSTLVVKNGYLIHETYYDDFWDASHARNIFSCTKSVISTLVGIAIEEGHISNVEAQVVDFFPDRIIANMDARKQAMTIEDLLTMTAGLDWDEWPYGPSSPYNQMTSSSDWVQFVLDRPMTSNPGERWAYNSGASHLLSVIVNISTGIFTHEYAEDRLFEPLGITEYRWDMDPQGTAFGGSSLQLRPRDMAKFGFLFLNHGNWDGTQVVPTEWTTTAHYSHITLNENSEYGYQWWVQSQWSCYSARGYNGQLIYVFPELNMVVVFTASTNSLNDQYLIENFILPAAGIFPGSIPPGSSALIAAIMFGTAAIILPLVVISFYIIYRRRRIKTI